MRKESEDTDLLQPASDRQGHRPRLLQWHGRLLPQDHPPRRVGLCVPGDVELRLPLLTLGCSFSRLYRGISAPIMMEAPKRATKFAANDEWGKFYRKAFGVEKMNQSLSVLTGATAGATESFV
jgi:hypothetical protein